MAFQARAIQVLICSPSDVQEERNTIENVIHAVNALHATDMQTVLLPVRWETHTSPAMGDRPQEIINKQIVEACDILVAAFWTRIGTPTGVAESGSVEEIQEFIAAGKPVLLYFSRAPVALDSIDPAQYERLKNFKRDCEGKGLIETYSDISEFQNKLHPHLVRTVREMQKEQRMNESEAQKTVGDSNEESTEATIGSVGKGALSARVQKIVGAIAFNNDYGQFVRDLDVAWKTERDSDPINTDEAKMILHAADIKLLQFRAHAFVYDNQQIAGEIDEILRALRALQRHQMFLDGGKSFREFWEIGNAVVERLKALAEKVFAMAENSTETKTEFAQFKNWVDAQVGIIKKIKNDITPGNRGAQIELIRNWRQKAARGIETALGGEERNKFASYKSFAAQTLYGETMGGLEEYIDTYVGYLQRLKENITSNRLLPTFKSADLEW